MIIQLIVIVASAKLVGALFKYLGQPQVCGEIAAGLLLGPSFFGALWPRAQQIIVNSSTNAQMTILSEVGLIFIMFLIGLEVNFGRLASSTRAAFSISTTGILLPFLLGIPLGRWIYSQMKLDVDKLAFTLFIAMTLSITAMPVLGRIMIEFNLARTRLGALAITAAAIGDVVGWLLLALISAVVAAQLHIGRILLLAAEVGLYVLAMIFIVRPMLIRWTRRSMLNSGGEISPGVLAQLIVFLLASAAITSAIGIFSVFGAFVMGGILHDQKAFAAAVNRRMSDFVMVFFLPVFFTFTGLRTDISSVQGKPVVIAGGLVILVACIGKLGGCSIAARIHGFTWRESFSVGAMMNTRGLVELVVLNIGYDLGIIPKPVFFIFVVMAITTTYMTAPLLRYFIHGTELQTDFEISTFMKERAPVIREANSRSA
ncbi:MAG TPA: cation:proton antiporter [Candidatus Angelobacter sp.]|nr:cation:proton antiporter [Candidatus Angelobacter sp.]